MSNLKAPIDYSPYQRTHNNAIDLVAQCVAYHKHYRLNLEYIQLAGGYYKSFVAAANILAEKAGADFDKHAEMRWEGVKIIEGPMSQFRPMIAQLKTGKRG